MKPIKIGLIAFIAMGLLTSCQTTSESQTDGDVKVNLDAEEKKELKESQEKMGGSHSLLRKRYKQKRFREFLAEAAKLLSKDEYDLRTLSILGIYHMDKKQYGAARIMFEKALERHKDEAGLYNNIAVIQLREGNFEAAVQTFKKAYDIDRDNLSVQANLGSLSVKYMDYVEAETLVEDVYAAMPDNSIVANNYAIVLRAQGQLEEAQKVYEKSLAINSRNISTNLNYAILLVEYMKKYEKARQVVDKIEFLNPTDKYVLAKVRDLQRKVAAAR